MKLFRLALLQLFVILLSSHMAFGQDDVCYKQLEDGSGYDASAFLNTLEPKACLVRSKFPDSLESEFRVYDFGYYLHSTKYQGDFQTELLDFPQFQDSITTDYYLIITKSTTDQGVYSGYEVFLNLPTVAPFHNLISADITAIARLVKYEIESIHVPGGNVTYSKEGIGAGLDLLATIIESIVNGSYLLTEIQLLSLNDFHEIAVENVSVTHTGSTTLNGSGLFDYAGLVRSSDGAWLKDSMQESLIINVDMANIVTDSENLSGFQGGQFPAADSSFIESGANFVFWYHFMLPAQGSGDVLRLFVKVRSGFTEEEAANMLYSQYLEARGNTSGSALQGDKDDIGAMRMSEDGCETSAACDTFDASWRLKGCLEEYATYREILIEEFGLGDVPIDIVDFQIGVYAGLFDGVLDVIMPLFTGTKFLVEGAKDHLFNSETFLNMSDWGKNFTIGAVILGGMFYSPINTAIFVLYGDDLRKIYSDLMTLISSGKYSAILKPIKEALNGFLADLTFQNGTVCAGHAVGLVVFEVILTIVSGGADKLRTVFKSAGTAMKGITSIGTALEKGLLKGISASKRTISKILIDGCFVEGTPVLMAHNPFKNVAPAVALATLPIVVPIQDVKVDDMVKAFHHEEMYLTASNNVDDIYVPGWQDYDYLDITSETWQVGRFIIEEENGSLVQIESNRPKQWFEDHELREKGDKAFITIEEMGIADYAVLQEIRPTDIDTRKFALNDSGKVDRPVITTYKRTAIEVLDYTFSNGQIISCTSNHPFYSSDREAYVPIGDLNIGETVLTAGEKEVKFIGGKSREKGEHVYNFEVWRENNYFVGFEGSEDFVLVHNSCWDILKDMFKIFGFHFDDAVKLGGKKWTHKVTPNDNPLSKEIDASEIIGEFKQERIVMTKAGTPGVDAISENADILSYKIMDGTTAQSNVNKLGDNISGAYTSYKNVPNNGMKAEIWVRGDHATPGQILAQWEQIKYANLNMASKSDFISKVYYIDNAGTVTELLW